MKLNHRPLLATGAGIALVMSLAARYLRESPLATQSDEKPINTSGICSSVRGAVYDANNNECIIPFADPGFVLPADATELRGLTAAAGQFFTKGKGAIQAECTLIGEVGKSYPSVACKVTDGASVKQGECLAGVNMLDDSRKPVGAAAQISEGTLVEVKSVCSYPVNIRPD